MSGVSPNPQNDPVLSPFLSARDKRRAQELMERLFDAPLARIRKITSRADSPDDAFQETMQKLVNRLWILWSCPADHTIGNFDYYVNSVASNTVSGQLRESHPACRRVSDALRYSLRSDPRFTAWTDLNGDKLFGLAVWQDRLTMLTRTKESMCLLEDPATLCEALPAGLHELNVADLLTEILRCVGHPIPWDRLLRVYLALKPAEDLTPIGTGEEDGPAPIDILPDSDWKPDEEAEFREFLSNVWSEIKQLLREQMIAYLLNFTAGDGQLDMFPWYGAATIRAIGAALELTDEQFVLLWTELKLGSAAAAETNEDKFARLWPHLPLRDDVIARMLGVTRQQVINLRKAAGARLSRRLSG